jgi:thiol-disulfide isomerase/thioredoxin
MIVFLSKIAFAMEIWTIPAMNCTGCEEKIQGIVDELKVSNQVKEIDYTSRMLCFQEAPSQDMAVMLEERLRQSKYIVTKKTTSESCHQEIRDPWSDTRGDFSIISHGERVSIRKQRVKGKYTIVDFSAIWCGPCHDISNQLKPLLEQRDDLAVRVIELPKDQKTAFDAPVVFQYMSQAEGLPYLILFDKRGKKQYEGSDLEELLQHISQ